MASILKGLLEFTDTFNQSYLDDIVNEENNESLEKNAESLSSREATTEQEQQVIENKPKISYTGWTQYLVIPFLILIIAAIVYK
jgi:hypothetical protein